MRFGWIDDAVIDAIHDAQLAEHGGLSGVRDAGMLSSALARPRNRAAYGNPDASDCAAAYGYGLARNHAFIDGDKRTAFVAVEVFLNLNGFALDADDGECVLTMLRVADGSLDEADFAAWIRAHFQPRP